MTRKRPSVWIGVGLLVIGILYIAYRKKTIDQDGEHRIETPYERALEGFESLEYHTRRALAYEAERSYEKAMIEYQKILEINPDDRVTHSHLGEIYYKMGKVDQAIAEIKEVLRLDPDNWAQQEALANLYCEQGKYDLAIREYEESLAANPNNALGNRLLGDAYYKVGYYIEAVRAYKESIAIEPAMGDTHLGLGLSYIAIGNMEGALKEKEILDKMDSSLASQLTDAIASAQKPE